MSKRTYCEGDVFAVPLREGGFALGVVARAAKDRKILIGYFFDPYLDEVPTECPALDPRKAIRIFRCGDLGLIKGEWPLVGKIPGWNRDLWPSPKFIREDPIVKRAWLITYSDDDPSFEFSEELCPFGLEGYERAGLAGSGVVEITLTKLLSNSATGQGPVL